MLGSTGLPCSEELAALPAQVLAERLLDALEQVQVLTGQVQRLSARVEQLERQARRDSSNSSKPPSSDGVFAKQPRSPKRTDRSLRQPTGRRPGKQPGTPGATMRLVPAPDARIACPPLVCAGCAGDLSGVPVAASERRQVREVSLPPPPTTVEYVLQTKVCPGCGTASLGDLPPGVDARAQYGPGVHALAANLVCGQHLPVGRAARLLAQMSGVAPSGGWMAGVRGKTARLLEGCGFAERVGELLRAGSALHADETPARAAGGTRYVHVAATRSLTLLHVGGRSAKDIDAGGVLPGYAGVLVRDGYAGYTHLSDAAHAWCAAHILRDLADVYEFEPARQAWAHELAGLLLEAKDTATAARAQGHTRLAETVTDDLVGRYEALVARGAADNAHRHGSTAADARRLARRLRDHQASVLRFLAHPDLDIFTNNEAERALRPVKVQMRAQGGCWRTLHGLAEFAIVHSYLSTAAKWGITSLDALRRLFTGVPWLPPRLAPT